MQVRDLFKYRNPEIRALHLTWIAFFICFYVWFNMAPLATSMLRNLGWLGPRDIKIIAISNVALTIPARLLVGYSLDKWGPRRVFSTLMAVLSIPAFVFAFGTDFMQLLTARLILSSIGAAFLVGIHMTALWFKPEDIGFAEGVYAGFGYSGTAAAAVTLPLLSIYVFGDGGWRYALALSAGVMFLYGVYYWFAITDGPSEEARERRSGAPSMEVSSRSDLVKLVAWTIPTTGVLALLVWSVASSGYISGDSAAIWYAVVGAAAALQAAKLLRVNVPKLRRGVSEGETYHFNSVAALNTTYFASFGAELAVVSMLPSFFEETWALGPVSAGLSASAFVLASLFARPLGGMLSDRLTSRKNTMVVYMLGIALGFFLMALMGAKWPLSLAVIVTAVCSFFVQGAKGATFGIIPSINRRLTGQISAMTGAYGSVGAVFYLTLYTFLSSKQFFFVLAGGAFLSFVFCVVFLREPQGGFAEEYHVSPSGRGIGGEWSGGR